MGLRELCPLYINNAKNTQSLFFVVGVYRILVLVLEGVVLSFDAIMAYSYSTILHFLCPLAIK